MNFGRMDAFSQVFPFFRHQARVDGVGHAALEIVHVRVGFQIGAQEKPSDEFL